MVALPPSETTRVPGHDLGRFVPVLAVAGLLAVELLALSLLYIHSFEFTCRDAAPAAFCAGLGLAVLRAIAAAGAAGMILVARPRVLARLRDGLRPRLALGPLALHGLGIAMVLAPWLFLADGRAPMVIAAGVALWLGGAALAVVGAALALAPIRIWTAAAKAAGPAAFGVLALALLAPEIATTAQALWSRFEFISAVTFASVETILGVMGYEIWSEFATRAIKVGEFGVLVGPQCSGVEGFALITAFLTLYIGLFREHLRFPAVWILLPLGILLSWVFNVLRISVLILIGHHVSPELAVEGFHSHAGWLMFTILAVGFAAIAHQVPALRRAGAGPAPTAPRAAPLPFLADPVVAMILPFIVFMLSALVLSTFTQLPSLHYPWRALAMAGALALFLPWLLRLEWRLDPLAIGSGLAIGLAWVLTAPVEAEASALAEALAQLSAPALAVWIVARMLGTAILVPVIEELFFRGYVLRTLDIGGTAMRLLALAVSTGLFAALHDRWLAAALAGVIFGLLMLRSGRVTDAILSHAAANALIAGVAFAEGDWSLI